VVGERSMGKGSAQRLRRLGERDVARMTTALLQSPKGRSLNAALDPDVAVPLPGLGRLGRLLVEKGVFFDFASLWCERHPDLVQRASLLGKEPRSLADTRRLQQEVTGQIRDTRDQIWADFVTFLTLPQPVTKSSISANASPPFLRSEDAHDARLKELAASLERQGLSAAAASVRGAREAEEADLQRMLSLRSSGVEMRLHEAILSRFISADARLLFKLGQDPVLSAALQALSNAERYTSILSHPPSSSSSSMTYGTGALGGAARSEAFEGGGGVFVEGYQETGFCLNGQTCNAQEYVYLQLL